MSGTKTPRDFDGGLEPSRPSLPPRPSYQPISEQSSETERSAIPVTPSHSSEHQYAAFHNDTAHSAGSARTSMTNDTKDRSLISTFRFSKAKDNKPPAPPPLPERPKVIYRNSARQFLKVQLPSVLVTIPLLVLYILQIQFVATPNQVAALLFAAKFHEGLITISLIDMVYYHVRRSLIGRKGVSYGLLSSPFQMTSPMYMFTSELWSGIKATRSDSILMSVLIVLSLILATVVGASSGNIMLPQPVWGADKRYGVAKSAFVVSPAGDMYPASIKDRWNTTSDKCQGNTNYCPYSKFVDPQAPIYRWISDTRVSDQSQNISIALDDRRQVMFAQRPTLYRLPIYTATVTPVCVGDNLSKNWDSIGSGDRTSARFMAITSPENGNELKNIKQPKVTASCFELSRTHSSGPDGIPDTFEMPRGFYRDFTIKVPTERFKEAVQSRANFGVMDMDGLLPPGNDSSLALWTKSPTQDNILGLCLFDARWINGNSWIYPRDPGARVLNDFQASDFADQTYDSLDQKSLVKIDKSWFESLNTTLSLKSQTLLLPRYVTHAFDLLDYYILDRGVSQWYYGQHNSRIAAAMTVLLTTALAQVPCQNSMSYAGTSLPEFTREYDQIKDGSLSISLPYAFKDLTGDDHVVLGKIFSELNYGYAFSGGVTKMSWIPLLAHLLLVIIHLCILLRNRGQGTTKAWGSLGELLTLAMNTNPPGVLTNAGGGVRDQSIWGLNTVVRQVGGEGGIGGRAGKIEFMLRDRRKYGRVEQTDGEDGIGGEDSDGVVLLDRMRRYG